MCHIKKLIIQITIQTSKISYCFCQIKWTKQITSRTNQINLISQQLAVSAFEIVWPANDLVKIISKLVRPAYELVCSSIELVNLGNEVLIIAIKLIGLANVEADQQSY